MLERDVNQIFLSLLGLISADQDAVLADSHISSSRNLLHEVSHEARTLTLGTSTRSSLLGNGNADDIQLLFRLLDEFAIRIVLQKLLVVFGSLVRFFFLLISVAQFEKDTIRLGKTRIFIDNFLQARLRPLKSSL